jgi:hypothetical protein
MEFSFLFFVPNAPHLVMSAELSRHVINYETLQDLSFFESRLVFTHNGKESVESQLKFRRNMSPLSSGRKNSQARNKLQAAYSQIYI